MVQETEKYGNAEDAEQEGVDVLTGNCTAEKDEFEAKHVEKAEKMEWGTVEVPQGQCVEEIIDMPVVVRRRLPTIQVPQKAEEAHQISIRKDRQREA